MEYRFPVVEIFDSIQGEGANAGMACTFVRFAGCNLKCSFCDTDYTVREYLTVDEIEERINLENIVVSGGEPLIHPIDEVVRQLRWDHELYVETNGSIRIPFFRCDAWITVSPKSLDFVQTEGDELKVLWFGRKFLDVLTKRIEKKELPFEHYFIQPIERNGVFENVTEIIDYIKENPVWRLSVQIHKILNIK